jgi:hypothetical protein
MRTFGIWVCGLLAALLIGGFIGSQFDTVYSSSSGAVFGAIAAMLVFACARLWAASGRAK